MKTFEAIKKPIPVKFIDPLTMNEEEIKSFNIQIKDGKWYMGTLEHKAYEFTPETHLIVEGVEGERYAITREIFKKTYQIDYLCLNDKIFTDPWTLMKEVEDIIKRQGLQKIIYNNINNEEYGIRIAHLLQVILFEYKNLQAKSPSKPTAMIITKLEEALMWEQKNY